MSNEIAKPPAFKTVSLSHTLPQGWCTSDFIFLEFNFDTQDFNSLGYTFCLPLTEDFFI